MNTEGTVLSEVKSPKWHLLPDSTYRKHQEQSNSENRKALLTRGQMEREMESWALSNVEFQLGKMEAALEVDGGGDDTIVWLYLMPLKCVLIH